MTAPAAALTRAEITAWRNALFVIFALCGLGIASWMARTPAIKDALGVSTAEMGILVLFIAIGSILGLLASSHLIALIGTRRLMAWCLGLGPLGLIVAGFGVTLETSGFWVVAGGLGFFGAALSTADVAMNLSGAVNERMLGRTVMPVYHAFFSLGTMLGAGVGALCELLSVPIPAQATVVSVIIIAAGALSVRATQREDVADVPDDDAPPSSWRDRLSIWRDGRTLLIGVLVLGMALAEGSANDWLALTMVEGHGMERASGALVFGLFVTAMTVGRLAGVAVLDRFGRVPVLRASAALAALGLVLVIFVPVVWVAVVGVALWGLGSALGFPTGMSAAADDPRTAAARVSAVATIGYLAFLAGPLTIGFLGEQFGLLRALLFVLVLVIAAGLASPAAREPRSIR
ncbi:MFS transporter [Salinibacterium sp. SYSU T00001]|uniref:MFS transporter n=1 Tax=Homoserinimonas sedimenticola TaxID=2986805 RepID=UPI00223654F3|nr:MFS transporter [Salinibacterium sedimenticola]MCW4385841.1 MFS transporter [Salinibacterium sedimenticola]